MHSRREARALLEHRQLADRFARPSAQQTLAFGSVADVREDVRHNIELLGKNGRYILAPCHNIQAVSPPENVVAMYEAGYEYGRL
jgi:uroporphyrinogen decarboxylase